MKNLLIPIIAQLQKKRPIFHSEADLQHALAWELHKQHPDAEIRLEYPINQARRTYLDMWIVFPDGQKLALELKYKTRRIQLEADSEKFILANHSAHDCGRYDALRDIQRIEEIVQADKEVFGAVLFMTNDSAYWEPPRTLDTMDASFRIHDESTLSGTRQWAAHTGAGTMKGREAAINIHGKYTVQWQEYSSFERQTGSRFRFFLLPINMTKK
ncbi:MULTISPECIES: hypothetical protein [Pelosinus]|nr:MULTISPECIES: hypothetical protein [Pelosinus]